ncbi:MAG: DUF3089 domain-containing protein [Steroidobacteraceae bacterium]
MRFAAALLAVGILLSAAPPGGAAAPAADAAPAAPTPRSDPRAWDRHQKSPKEPVAAVDWFTPTVPIGEGEGAPLRVASESERTLPAAALDAARDYAVQLNSYGLIVAHRGVIQLEHYKEGFGPDRQLDSQSLHKPLAAILTMAAVADGKLSLDDPMSRFIPRWRRDPRGAITVRDVLYMQTGLGEPRYEEAWGNPGYQMFITSRIEDYLFALPRESAPGEHFRSHYAATQLLQFVLERATGRRYADYLRERLWQPLGGGAARVRLDRPNGNAQVFCCLQARPRDWLRVGLMLSKHGSLDGRTVLPLDTFLQLTAPSPLAPNFAMQQIWRGSPYSRVRMMDSRNPARGLPMSAPFAIDDVFYLEGRGGQRVYVVPSRELVVVRQGEVRMEWDDAAFLNGLIAAAAPAADKAPAFSALLAPPAPDYTQASAWAHRPAQGATRTGTATQAAAFYIHHTTYGGREWWNAPHDAPDVVPGVDAVVAGQGSVFESCCDWWAPRYRQASLLALGNTPQAYDLAFLDVRAAFRQFLEEIGERPFVILGHSQGALHTQTLVTDVIERDPALRKRLVAAYVVGIPVPMALYGQTLRHITACTTPTQTRCIATWSTFTDRFTGLAQWRGGTRARFAALMQAGGTQAIQCTNPLSWRADEVAVPAAQNLGATLFDPRAGALMPPVAGLVDARCVDGALLAAPEPPAPFSALAMVPGNYHLADVALFHANVARNIADRIAAWGADR